MLFLLSNASTQEWFESSYFPLRMSMVLFACFFFLWKFWKFSSQTSNFFLSLLLLLQKPLHETINQTFVLLVRYFCYWHHHHMFSFVLRSISESVGLILIFMLLINIYKYITFIELIWKGKKNSERKCLKFTLNVVNMNKHLKATKLKLPPNRLWDFKMPKYPFILCNLV